MREFCNIDQKDCNKYKKGSQTNTINMDLKNVCSIDYF